MEGNTTLNASLDQLHDIIIPPAVSNWPLAPGWYALALLLLAYGLHIGLKYWSLYRKNLYRREALQELSGIMLAEEPSTQVKALLGLMKRVGIQCYGREKVAALNENEWWDFMENHSKVKADPNLRELGQKVLYGPDTQVTADEVKAVVKVAKVWINTHQGEEDA